MPSTTPVQKLHMCECVVGGGGHHWYEPPQLTSCFCDPQDVEENKHIENT